VSALLIAVIAIVLTDSPTVCLSVCYVVV